MIILFILGLLLGVFSVIFALQNTEVVTVTFFNWDLTSSLSVVFGLAVFSGMLVVVLISLPSSIKSYIRYRKLAKTNRALEEELKKQKEKVVFAKTVEAKPEDIAKIENGVIDDKIF